MPQNKVLPKPPHHPLQGKREPVENLLAGWGSEGVLRTRVFPPHRGRCELHPIHAKGSLGEPPQSLTWLPGWPGYGDRPPSSLSGSWSSQYPGGRVGAFVAPQSWTRTLNPGSDAPQRPLGTRGCGGSPNAQALVLGKGGSATRDLQGAPRALSQDGRSTAPRLPHHRLPSPHWGSEGWGCRGHHGVPANAGGN